MQSPLNKEQSVASVGNDALSQLKISKKVV
jgi:hypothetical protein